MTQKNYIENQYSKMERALKRGPIYSKFNNLDNQSKKSFVHILVGIHEYIFAYSHVDLPLNEVFFEYTVSNITDATFSGISGNGGQADNNIDGFLFLDSDGLLVSGDDPQEVCKIVLYQSKSGFKSINADTEINQLLINLQSIIDYIQHPKKTINLVSNNVLEKVYNILSVEGIDRVSLLPLLISLNHEPNTSNFKISPTSISAFNNNYNYGLDFDEIIFSISSLAKLNITQTKTSSLKLTKITSYPYPSSKVYPYIGFAYIFDYLNFLNKFVDKSFDQRFLLDEGLFLKNIRSNIGNTAVNKAIYSTFLAGPETFPGDMWWLSNGITIIAKDISISGNSVKLTLPSIVNGQQTSRQLAAAFVKDQTKFLENNPSFSPWKLMIKIFVGNYDDENVNELISQIISGLNSQSAINNNSIDLIYEETLSFKDALSKEKIQFEIRNGEYSQNSEFIEKNQKKDILYIEEFIQYAASAMFVKDNNSPINIGKIRSSKRFIVRDFHRDLFVKNHIDQNDLVLLAQSIKLFKKNLSFTQEEVQMGMQYLSFAVFRLAFMKFQVDIIENKETTCLINKDIFKYFTTPNIEKMKNRLAKMMDDYPNSNWDQVSKLAKFQEMLESVLNQG